MKTYIKYFAGAIVIAAGIFLTRCSDIPDGYISDTIIYYTNPIPVVAGVTMYSITPDLGNSTTPVEFEIIDVKDSDGNSTDELTKMRDIYIWTSPYDSNTDTTVALVQAKRVLSESDYTTKLLTKSGQFLFTEATSDVTPGTYSISLKMSNSAGTRIFNDVVDVRVDLTEWQWIATGWHVEHIQTGNGWWMGQIGTMECEVNPEGPNKMHIQICDQYGNPFDWKNGEVVMRGDRPAMEYATRWAEPIYTETEAIYEYPFTPFPFGLISNLSGDITTDYCYYRVLPEYAKLDGYDAHMYNINVTYGFYLYREGEWTIKISYPGVTRVPKTS